MVRERWMRLSKDNLDGQGSELIGNGSKAGVVNLVLSMECFNFLEHRIEARFNTIQMLVRFAAGICGHVGGKGNESTN